MGGGRYEWNQESGKRSSRWVMGNSYSFLEWLLYVVSSNKPVEHNNNFKLASKSTTWNFFKIGWFLHWHLHIQILFLFLLTHELRILLLPPCCTDKCSGALLGFLIQVGDTVGHRLPSYRVRATTCTNADLIYDWYLQWYKSKWLLFCFLCSSCPCPTSLFLFLFFTKEIIMWWKVYCSNKILIETKKQMLLKRQSGKHI